MMLKAPENYTYDKVMELYQELQNERSEWEAEWRKISDFLIPGRGVYQTYSKPRKRKLTSSQVINTVGEDSLYILTSGLHSRLTSPSMPWFKLRWSSSRVNEIEVLKSWLQQSEVILHQGLHASNFYSVINSFYVEYGGFGTAAMYTGSDTGDVSIPFRFELLTAGEYAVSYGANGRLEKFIRTIFMSPRQLYERFPETVSPEIKEQVEKNQDGVDTIDLSVVEVVCMAEYMDKPVMRLFYEVSGYNNRSRTADKEPLEISGFYEFPYIVARWSTIGSDIYGIGPGARALPDIQRLQEMEKAFLMATHKSINPPLNAPNRMKGKLSTLPGGMNYYSNPNETVNELYQVRFDYTGVSAAVERVEMRIQKNFFNDVFLTATRDPNASPLKATQVLAQQQEQMFRLGPVVERLQSEFFTPLIKRCFNIMHRDGHFPLMSPEMEEMMSDLEITLVSPMASAQKAVKSQGTDAFMGFLGQAAQFDPTILDNVNPDAAARQRADIEGVDLGILRPIEEVQDIRRRRAEAQEAQRKQEQQIMAQQLQQQGQLQQAEVMKTQAEAGKVLAETQQTAIETGVQ